MSLLHLSKLSDLSEIVHWEAFHAASDVVNYLNLSEEEKHKPLGEW